MANPPKDVLPQQIMFLCLGAASLLLLHWGTGVNNSAASWQPLIASEARPPQPSVAPVKASASPMPSRLVVDLSDRRVYVFNRERQVASYALAIGQKGWETPTGKFQVIQMQQNPQWVHPITGEVVRSGPKNPLGKRWIGFWTDGHGQIGFHGTAQEQLIGRAVSHGCLRMRNQDVEALYKQVQIGTPIVVRS